MIEHTNVIFIENEFVISWSIGPSAACNRNHIGHDRTDHNGVVYAKNEIELLSLIRPTIVYAENKTKLSSLIGPGVVYDKNQIGQRCD